MPTPTLITDLSTTAGSNFPIGSVDSPAVLDDVQRAHAAFIAQLRDGTQSQAYIAFTTGGTSTAFTLTPSPAITSYIAGQSFFVTFNAASGAAPTLTISGVATPPNLVKQHSDGTYVNLAANDILISHRSRVTLLSATQALVEKMPVVPLATTVTTNANLTGPVTSTGNATAVADAAFSIAKTSGLQVALDGKQATLVSGTNIKTVNGSSVLGSGDVVVGSLAVSVVTLTTQLAVASNHYILTNVAATAVTLPVTPASGDTVWVTWANTLATNTITRNGQTIMGLAEDMTLDASLNGTVQLRFVSSSWRIL